MTYDCDNLDQIWFKFDRKCKVAEVVLDLYRLYMILDPVELFFIDAICKHI